ncbi:MAG: hypothetical protein WCA46_00775 [Actinocatenispora sp.]
MYPGTGWPTHGQTSGQPAGYQPARGPYARVPGPGWAPEHRISLGDGLAAFGGLLIFAFSFAPFIAYDDDRLASQLDSRHLPAWFSAWATETFMAPLTWFIVLAGLIMISLSASHLAISRDREVTGFRTSHLQIGVTLFAFLSLFGYATSAKRVFFGHDLAVLYGDDSNINTAMSFSWGGWLMLFGALIAVVGAVIGHLELGPTLYPQPPRPVGPPTGYGPPAPQYPPAGPDNGATAVYPTVPPPGPQQGYPQQQPPPAPQPQQPPQYGPQDPTAGQWQGQ